MNFPIPQSYQIVTNPKLKNKLVAKDYYDDVIQNHLQSAKEKNLAVRSNWTVNDFDAYIKAVVGNQVIQNEFYSGIQENDKGEKTVKRKQTKKTLIAAISKELELPELAISYIYDDIVESDLLRTKKNEAKNFVNINVENSLNELELAIMKAEGKDKADLIKAKTQLLKLYLESNDAISKQATTINNVTGQQTNMAQAQIQNNLINGIDEQAAAQSIVSQLIHKRRLAQQTQDEDIYDA